jgi:hypothetical protein
VPADDFFDALRLPLDGSYTILVDPQDVNTGSLRLRLSAR